MTERDLKGIDALYSRPFPARRTGPLYAAFPYPTKISPDAIALFIVAHTEPGHTVFDGFAGSGTTGLAALTCDRPSPELETHARQLGLRVNWGPRHAVLYELGVVGSLVAKTLTNPPDPVAFRQATNEILRAVIETDGWMYSASFDGTAMGTIRHVVWSEELQCPVCHTRFSLWESAVSRGPAQIKSRFVCRSCRHSSSYELVERVTETTIDDLLSTHRTTRVRQPQWLYGVTGREYWSRPFSAGDREVLRKVDSTPIPPTVPVVPIPWGDLYRGGYHQGISHVHHFYTRRNLIVFGRLWQYTDVFGRHLRDALRLWLLSYNASHSTLMSRVVAKSGQPDLVVTSAQPGVLYFSGLPVEKNLIRGLGRKRATIARAFEVIHRCQGRVDVHQESSCRTHLPSRSVDYVFTDPPFGANIPYSEVSFLNEAWLGSFTDRTEEAIVSKSQGKTLADYQGLLGTAFRELRRILKPQGNATVVFHSASAAVWHAIQGAYVDAGFEVQRAGVLDKTQGSFKQVTTHGAVRGDALILLGDRSRSAPQHDANVWAVVKRLQQEADANPATEVPTAQRLYSRLVAHYLRRHQRIPVDADAVYRWHAHYMETRERQ